VEYKQADYLNLKKANLLEEANKPRQQRQGRPWDKATRCRHHRAQVFSHPQRLLEDLHCLVGKARVKQLQLFLEGYSETILLTKHNNLRKVAVFLATTIKPIKPKAEGSLVVSLKQQACLEGKISSSNPNRALASNSWVQHLEENIKYFLQINWKINFTE
jgi:hypothetical protein